MMNDFTIAFSKGLFLGTNNDADLASKIVDLENPAVKPVFDFQNMLMRFGFMLDEDSLKYLAAIRPNHLEEIKNTTIEFLKESCGDGNFKTLFGSFPAVVNNMTEEEMFVCTILHYMSFGTFVPGDIEEFKDTMRSRGADLSDTSDEAIKNYCANFKTYKTLKFFAPTTYAEFFDVILKPILKSETSITGYDKDIIEFMAKTKPLGDYINDYIIDIPFKENLCMLALYCPTLHLKTVTDVLRYAAYTSSNADLTLSQNPRFVKYGRPMRKDILGRLEWVLTNGSYENSLAEMKLKANYWIRLGEVLHPGEYTKNFPMSSLAYNSLRENINSIKTFNSEFESVYKNGNLDEVLAVLTKRPGEFARHIDSVIRKFGDTDFNFNKIVNSFMGSIQGVSSKVLYELIDHFNGRIDNYTPRTISLPTSSKRITLKNLNPLPARRIDKLTSLIIDEIMKRFKGMTPLDGKYIISTDLSYVNLPKGMRTKSFSIGQMTRGTGIPFNTKTGVLRCYLRWHDKSGYEDLDLSATFYSDDLKHTDMVSWNTSYKKPYSAFSGDVRCVRGDVAEYIDVDINGALTAGMRYLVVTANDYNRHKFNCDAWCGIMELPKFNAVDSVQQYNRVSTNFEWLPAAVSTGFKLSAGNYNESICAVVDLVDQRIYVVDENAHGSIASCGINTFEAAVKRFVKTRPNFTAFDVIKGNISNRTSEESVRYMSETEIDDYLTLRDYALGEINSMVEAAAIVTDEDKKSKALAMIEDLKVKYAEFLEPAPTIIRFHDIADDYNKLLDWMF